MIGLRKFFGSHPIIQMEPEKTPLGYHEMGNTLRRVLYRFLDTKFEEWYSNTRNPLKIGDIVVLDKYNLNKSFNSWDGGPRLLIGRSSQPFKLEIVDIFGSISLSYELADRYLNNIDYTDFINSNGEVEENYITFGFEKYLNRSTTKPFGMEVDNRYGFYVSCKYKPVDDTEVVCYISGLNIRSFILSDTENANITVQLWEQEYELYLSEQRVNELRSEIENKKKDLNELVQRTVGLYGK
jgi:hypothetical protein